MEYKLEYEWEDMSMYEDRMHWSEYSDDIFTGET